MQQDGNSGDSGDFTPFKPVVHSFLDLSKAWVSRYEGIVRSRKYEHLWKLFHANVVWFGINSNICVTLEAAIEKECKEVWPNQIGFTIDLAKANIIPDAQGIMLIAPWVASGKVVGGPRKRGRITLLLGIFEAGKILCVHLHQSHNPTLTIE